MIYINRYMKSVSEMLENVINSPEIKKMFLSIELKNVMNKKFSEPPPVKTKNKRYRVVLEVVVQSIEEIK